MRGYNFKVLNLHSTFESNPVVLNKRFCAAVITEYPGFCVSELGRHGLGFNIKVVLSESYFHVDHAFAADWTLERILHMFFPTHMVDTVTTSHENHSLWRRKHVFAADGAVAVR